MNGFNNTMKFWLRQDITKSQKLYVAAKNNGFPIDFSASFY
jgi:hypothetical protein